MPSESLLSSGSGAVTTSNTPEDTEDVQNPSPVLAWFLKLYLNSYFLVSGDCHPKESRICVFPVVT